MSPLGDGDAGDDHRRRGRRRRGQQLAEDEDGPQEGEQRLGELELAGAGDAERGQAPGYHLWLRLPDGQNPQLVTAAALRAGVAITPGGPYFTAEPPAPYIRKSYACTGSADLLADAVTRLRGILGQPG